MKRGRESAAQCETEKQPDPQTSDSSENPKQNRTNRELSRRGLQGD